MSLTALKLASSSNPVSGLMNNPRFPLICATALATLDFALAFNITRLRLQIGGNQDEYKPGGSFDYLRRAQMNVAEYSGTLLALLLFLQYKSDQGAAIGRSGKLGSLLVTFGTFLYTFGYSNQKEESKTPIGRLIGATSRYIGFAMLCFQFYTFSKQ